jgi:heat shock protein HslJ
LIGCSDKKPVTTSAPNATTANTSASMPANLVGTEWRLEDLGGAGIIDNSQATIAFPDAGRVAGNSSCNRFTGTVTITGDTIKMGPLATTRMACMSEAISTQEAKYLKALEGATRYEWKDPYLLIYCDGLEKPLRFTKVNGK